MTFVDIAGAVVDVGTIVAVVVYVVTGHAWRVDVEWLE